MEGYLVFVWKPSGYELSEQNGDLPALGSRVEHEGRWLKVAKIAPSPLPGDKRPCVYLGS